MLAEQRNDVVLVMPNVAQECLDLWRKSKDVSIGFRSRV
jgi:hypothetical protein